MLSSRKTTQKYGRYSRGSNDNVYKQVHSVIQCGLQITKFIDFADLTMCVVFGEYSECSRSVIQLTCVLLFVYFTRVGSMG